MKASCLYCCQGGFLTSVAFKFILSASSDSSSSFLASIILLLFHLEPSSAFRATGATLFQSLNKQGLSYSYLNTAADAYTKAPRSTQHNRRHRSASNTSVMFSNPVILFGTRPARGVVLKLLLCPPSPSSISRCSACLALVPADPTCSKCYARLCYARLLNPQSGAASGQRSSLTTCL